MKFMVVMELEINDKADFIWTDDYEGVSSVEEHFTSLIYDEDDIKQLSLEVRRKD